MKYPGMFWSSGFTTVACAGATAIDVVRHSPIVALVFAAFSTGVNFGILVAVLTDFVIDRHAKRSSEAH